MNIDFEFTSSNSASDINDDWNLWRDTFLEMADEHIPRKIVKGRYNPRWITPAIISLIKKKETTRRKVRRKEFRCPVREIQEPPPHLKNTYQRKS